MYIITQGVPFEEYKDKIYRVKSPAEEEKYPKAGYQRHEREYKITCGHKDYIVICHEYRKDEKGHEPVVIIPDFLMRGRRYPVEVYLYAIEIYSGNPEKGQRKAAEETRKRFDLATFAHTTLGRALKALVCNLNKAAGTNADREESGVEAEPTEDGGGRKGNTKAPGFPTVQATRPLRERAAQFLDGNATHSDLQMVIAAYRKKARDWFLEHRRLLL
ncbi:MAG: hypothetical protein LBH28_01285 [Oscillospiraceae bacterium]|jgi:hypothetical protein|nr:hypothetical protein [Oscillospiraceae bacterium]